MSVTILPPAGPNEPSLVRKTIDIADDVHLKLWWGVGVVAILWGIAIVAHMMWLDHIVPAIVYLVVGVWVLIAASKPTILLGVAGIGVITLSLSRAFGGAYFGLVRFQALWFMHMLPLIFGQYYMIPEAYAVVILAAWGFWMFDNFITSWVRRALKWPMMVLILTSLVCMPYFPHLFVDRFDPNGGESQFLTTVNGDELYPTRLGWSHSPASGLELEPASYEVIRSNNLIAILQRNRVWVWFEAETAAPTQVERPQLRSGYLGQLAVGAELTFRLAPGTSVNWRQTEGCPYSPEWVQLQTSSNTARSEWALALPASASGVTVTLKILRAGETVGSFTCT